MSERDHPFGPDSDRAGPPLRPTKVRLSIEFALLFAVALLLKQLLVGGVRTRPIPIRCGCRSSCSAFEHGLAAGLAATIIAIGLQFSTGLPPTLLTDDMYSYIGRIAAEPISWACVALLIGHIRSQQIAQVERLEAELAERNAQCAAVADLCVDLRDRSELLERHIAANAHSSNVDIAEAIRELHDATWDGFAERLTRFVTLMTGAAEFSVYLLRDNVLKVVFQPNDEHTAGRRRHHFVRRSSVRGDRPPNDGPLLATRPADQEMLGNRGVLIGPLLDAHAQNRVIGMFAIGGGALDDHPEDIERRFSLTLSEISRVLGRIILIENWHAAAAPGQSNGHLDANETGCRDVASAQRSSRAGTGRPRTAGRSDPAMTDIAQTSAAGGGTASPGRACEGAALDVHLADVLVALVTFVASLAVLVYGMSAQAWLPVFLLLHLAVLSNPDGLLLIARARRNEDLTVPALLLIVTCATGPIGAIGCAAMALSLWSRQPSPARLQEWYDYISGVVERGRVAHLYDELISDRLPTDPEAKVPRFTPILQGSSIEEQQRVLGVIGRRYHADFRPVLRKALRNKNGFIRAQAAAIASRLSAEEKNSLWSGQAPDRTPRRRWPARLDAQQRGS